MRLSTPCSRIRSSAGPTSSSLLSLAAVRFFCIAHMYCGLSSRLTLASGAARKNTRRERPSTEWDFMIALLRRLSPLQRGWFGSIFVFDGYAQPLHRIAGEPLRVFSFCDRQVLDFFFGIAAFPGEGQVAGLAAARSGCDVTHIAVTKRCPVGISQRGDVARFAVAIESYDQRLVVLIAEQCPNLLALFFFLHLAYFGELG